MWVWVCVCEECGCRAWVWCVSVSCRIGMLVRCVRSVSVCLWDVLVWYVIGKGFAEGCWCDVSRSRNKIR